MRFINARRIQVYPRIAVFLATGGWLAWTLSGDGLADPRGEALGADFVTFYAAADLALDGRPAEAYEPEVITAAEQEIVKGDRGVSTWGYPPFFFLSIIPLALLPYLAAIALWTALGTVAWLVTAKLIAPVENIGWLAAASGGFIQCATQGQTGILIAVALGLGLLALPRNQYLGGALLGLVAFKPQMAPLIPVAILAGRYWRAIVPGVACAGAFALLSLLFLGADTWEAFANAGRDQVDYFESGYWDFAKMPTVGSTALLAGLPVPVARGLQTVAAVGAASGVAWLWYRDVPYRVKAAGLAFAVLLATPYAYDYDMAITAVGLAFLGMEAYETGWLRWEKEGLLMGYLLPYVFGPVAALTGVQLGPLGIIALFALALRRAAVTAPEPIAALAAPAVPGESPFDPKDAPEA